MLYQEVAGMTGMDGSNSNFSVFSDEANLRYHWGAVMTSGR